MPDPGIVALSGSRVRVHEPGDGSPLSSAEPVGTSYVGWVITPMAGAEGTGGCTGITIFPDSTDVHPD